MSKDVPTNRRRLVLLFSLLAVCAVILSVRLAYWQIVRHEEMATRATKEHKTEVDIAPRRGTITDRRGYVLATTVSSYLVYAAPKEVRDDKQLKPLADKVAPLLGLSSPAVLADLQKNRDKYYVLLKRRVTATVVEQVAALKLQGIHVQQEAMRVYPADGLAEPLLGFANFDAVGANGVEGYYNGLIRGTAGSLVAERDSLGREIAIGYREFIAAEDGASLALTLDTAIQYAAEKKLREAIAANGAVGGTILIMHVKTGAILASASTPGYNPNRFYEIVDPSVFVNPTVSQFWEPGSIFKLITMAAGLDSGVVGPRTTHNCNGQVVVDGLPIRTWNSAAHGVETMTQVLQNSCNVGAVYVANALGSERFYDYVLRFGFGKRTGVDLQGEVVGTLHLPGEREWRRIDQATNSFGQGMGVTPMQMIAAVAAIANNGKYMQPYLADRLESNGVSKSTVPKAVAQVISPQAARTLTDMLVSVVNQPGYPAYIPGYRVAGKTGTAQVVVNGNYDPNLTITSYVGYAPAENPQFAILIKIDKSQKSPWAQDVAAPVFHDMAEWLLHYLRIPATTQG